MTAFTVLVAPDAEKDIVEAFNWYCERNALVADSFRTQVFAVVERIGQAPLARPVDENGNRHRVVRQFPYSVWYEVQGQTVTVLAVAHHRRRPGYWRV